MFISHVEKVTIKEDIAGLKAMIKALKVTVDAMQADIMTLKLGRPVVLKSSAGAARSSSITVTVPKKRGRPVGSKNKPKGKK